MRLALLVLAVPLALGACQTAGVGSADITNNLQLACSSAQALLSLASLNPSKFGASAAKLSDKVGAYCGVAIAAGPALTAALGQINTAGAVLLGKGVAKQK